MERVDVEQRAEKARRFFPEGGDCRKERRKLGSTSERLYLLYFEDGFGGADR